MKKFPAIVLAAVFGNALPVIVCAACIEVRLLWAAAVIGLGYTAVSVISARRFKSRFGFGYRKYFFLCALPAFVVTSFLWLVVFGADSAPWVFCAFASIGSGAYCLLFGGSLLAVWGREEYGK